MPNKSFCFPKLIRRSSYSIYSEYRDYRQEIREDCQGKCVYCDIHENELDGIEFMTLDHFRPKKHYPKLTHNPNNLVWSCFKCNHLKGSIWPGLGTSNTIIGNKGFIDPFEDDPNNYFEVQSDGWLLALKPPAKFMIKLLLLNRKGARRIRELRNKKFEAILLAEKTFNITINYVNTVLSNLDLSEEERKSALEHKKYLEDQHEMLKEGYKLDFTLY